MIPLEEVITFLRRLEALGWLAQDVGLALLSAGYVLLILIAWRIGRRNGARLEDENTALEKQVAKSKAKRDELRDNELKLKGAIKSLQDQRPEEGLACAVKELKHRNEEGAIEIYEKIFATFGPCLARCCEALAAGGDEPDAERYRKLAVGLADMDAQR